jgi:hypothetical protein
LLPKANAPAHAAAIAMRYGTAGVRRCIANVAGRFANSAGRFAACSPAHERIAG